MIKILSSLFFVLNFSVSLMAQTSPQIRTGRPGQSIGAYVVGTGVTQIQSGLEYNRLKTNSEDLSWINNNILRYGLNERTELSGVLDYRTQNLIGTGVDNFQLGGRVNILNPEKNSFWSPALCFQARLRFKGGGDFKKNKNAPQFILSSVSDLGSLGSLTVNYTLSYDGFSTKGVHGHTLAWGISLDEKWGAFIEEYATYPESGGSQHFVDTGFSYLQHKDLQWDIAFGVDIESQFDQEYLAIGLSWRTM